GAGVLQGAAARTARPAGAGAQAGGPRGDPPGHLRRAVPGAGGRGVTRRNRRIMADLVDQGTEGIVLGCTEISLLVAQRDASVPLFDTTTLHARKAAECALLE